MHGRKETEKASKKLNICNHKQSMAIAFLVIFVVKIKHFGVRIGLRERKKGQLSATLSFVQIVVQTLEVLLCQSCNFTECIRITNRQISKALAIQLYASFLQAINKLAIF